MSVPALCFHICPDVLRLCVCMYVCVSTYVGMYVHTSAVFLYPPRCVTLVCMYVHVCVVKYVCMYVCKYARVSAADLYTPRLVHGKSI
jgi:hypothetical protein